VRLLEHSVVGHPRVALKLASAFGGANAALVVSADEPPPPRAARPAFVHAAAYLAEEPTLDDLAAVTTMTVERLGRTDGLVRRVLGAVARLQRSTGPLAGAGIVVGSALATVETNASFAARLRARGPRAVEPRLFPYTSPNAAPGECSIAFGLTGPGFAVGGGLHAAVEALAAAALLVEAGDAERVVVVAADDAGPAGRALGGEHLQAGAVAVLLSAEPGGARAKIGRVTLRRGAPVSVLRAPGHVALRPLASGELPREIASANPPDAHGRIELLPR
jgi:3-oxoacyl-[acyl-carrier-protein] synthase-1/3-oxoacyl-[acyl-carrier-protein] synthase II